MPKQKRKLEPGIHILLTGDHRWYWVLMSKNGRELIASAPAFSKQAVIKNISAVAAHFENNQHYYDHTTPSAKKSGMADLVMYERPEYAG
jgi:hypothetical protein